MNTDPFHIVASALSEKGRVSYELMVRLNALLSRDEWLRDHSKWVNRAIDEPDKMARVLSEVETVKREMREGDCLRSVAAYAEDLWKRFK